MKDNLELDRAKFEFGAILSFMAMTLGVTITSIFAHDRIISPSLKAMNNLFLIAMTITLGVQLVLFIRRLREVRRIYNAINARKDRVQNSIKRYIISKVMKKKKRMTFIELFKATTPMRYYSYVEGLYIALAVTFAIISLDYLGLYYNSLFPKLTNLQISFYKMVFVLFLLLIISIVFTVHLIKHYKQEVGKK